MPRSPGRGILLVGVEPAVAVLEGTTVFALTFGIGLSHVTTLVLAVFYLTVVHSVFVWVATQDPPDDRAVRQQSLGTRDFYFHARSVSMLGAAPRASLSPAAVIAILDLLSVVLGGMGRASRRWASPATSRSTARSLRGRADLLNWGSWWTTASSSRRTARSLAGWRYWGPGVGAATPEELNALSQQVNDAVLPFTDTWMFHVDAIRRPAPS